MKRFLRSSSGRACRGVVVVAVFAFLASGVQAAPPSKPALLSGHEIAFDSSGDPSPTTLQSARAECPPGTGVISGGYSFSNSGIEAYVLIANHPSGDFTVQEPGGEPIEINNGWLVSVLRTDGQSENWGVSAYAVCVDTE